MTKTRLSLSACIILASITHANALAAQDTMTAPTACLDVAQIPTKSSGDGLATSRNGLNTPRTWTDCPSAEIQVLDFGADPTGRTDSSAALQAAIDAAARRSNGAIVRLSPGEFRAGGLVISSSKIQIRGSGRNTSIIVGNSGMDALAIDTSAGSVQGILLADFQIRGGNRGLVARGPNSLAMSEFRRLLITETSSAGIYIGNDLFGMFETSWEQVYVWGGTGSYIGPRSFHIGTLVQCFWKNSRGSHGLTIANAADVRLVDNLFETNQQSALGIDRVFFGGVMVEGGWFEKNAALSEGGPYPIVTISRSSATPDINTLPSSAAEGYGGIVTFRNVHFAPQQAGRGKGPANDGATSVKVISDKVAGPLVFDDCNFLESKVGYGLGAVDLGTFRTKPAIEIRGTKLAPKIIGGSAYHIEARATTYITDGGRIRFLGHGRNDLLVYGPETSSSGHVYTFEVERVGSPDVLRFRIDGGSWVGGKPCITSATGLGVNGISYKCRQAEGHTVGDRWIVETVVTNPLRLRSSEGNDIFVVQNTGSVYLGASAGTLTEVKADGTGSLDIPTGSVKALAYETGSAPAREGAVRLSAGDAIRQRNFANSADRALIRLDQSSGREIVVVGDPGAALKIGSNLAVPGTPSEGEWWVECSGVTPSRTCSLKVRDQGAVRAIATSMAF